ncbi:MAG: hypothetical protein KC910_03850 [Candidatus Eremiobacteraeota bacterium]|nr:hypothetical protein [Candidatus Eremiobacteraeota bacterium]
MEVPDQEAYLKARDREWQVSKFNRVFGEAAWSVRDHWGNTNYWASRLEGREVAFYAPDEQGDLTLHRGVASRSPEASSTSSLFSLEGQSETFNTNTLATLAVAPPEIPAAQAPGAGFDWRYGEAGWKLRQGQFDNDFWLSSIQGREIAFSGTNDSGEAYECRGKLEQLGGPLSARFGLAGQPGEWNFYAVDKMALRPQQPRP